ncbi:hypothetical protein [Saccharibacillus alkalitolerans]|uniref:Lipoprotein n=1 Tax=Saccharibacillus alkalitolerans TaxID=2705290 RepID=A0ABX0F2W8_9BACL|nr:hypothetical protein [Saccharibacillus alkalitolerans]NGZ75338.1 hypothetical protein [Saccharibacillus alkalitolerans]
MNKTAKMMSLASALLLTFALTACSTAKAPAPEPGEVPANTTQEPPADPAPSEPAKPDESQHEAVEATGVYNGQADPHTIEVNVDGKPTSFQLSEGAASQLEGLNEGDTISFEYVEHPVEGSGTPQLEIQSLAKADAASSGEAGEGTGTAGGTETPDETAASERPATKEISMMSEGMPDKRTAALKQGDGYSLYVFDAYTFDDAKNRLYLTAYPDYYADIEVLPAKVNLDELRKSGEAEFKQYGEVKEYSGDQLAEGPLYGASLLLQVSDEKGVHDYVVWEPGGSNAYVFRVHAPSGEASETFLTPALTSLTSIQADSGTGTAKK